MEEIQNIFNGYRQCRFCNDFYEPTKIKSICVDNQHLYYMCINCIEKIGQDKIKGYMELKYPCKISFNNDKSFNDI